MLAVSCSYFNFWKKEQPTKPQQFVNQNTDLPLMEGLSQIDEDSVGFDGETGSIVSVSYESKIVFSEVQKFYLETLPQMGWKLSSNENDKLIFNREKDKVEIEFYDDDSKNIVKFFISSML